MSELPHPPVIKVERYRFAIDEPSELILLHNDWRFLVRLSRNVASCESIQQNFLRRIDAAEKLDDYAELINIFDEIEKLLLTILPPYLDELKPESQHPKGTLHWLCAPPAKAFELVTVDGEAKLEPGIVDQSLLCPRIDLDPDISAATPRFRSSEIIVLEQLYSARVTRVSVEGQEFCCKVAEAYYPDLIRELPVMQRIAQRGQSMGLRVPILRGLVISEEGESVIGYLMDYIRTKPNFRHLGEIAAEVEGIDLARRLKWANQVENTIGRLHQMGIYWGDAKPDNVLVDLDDDAWLIDLGGNRTEGWVSESLKDSIEGDLEGLRLIQTYLGV